MTITASTFTLSVQFLQCCAAVDWSSSFASHFCCS